MDLVKTPIKIDEQNRKLSVNINLDEVSTKFNYSVSAPTIDVSVLEDVSLGYATINRSINFLNTLQFCLNPTPPAGWANLVMDFSVD